MNFFFVFSSNLCFQKGRVRVVFPYVIPIKPKSLYIWLKTIELWFKMVNEKTKILQLLIENTDKDYSIRQISKIRAINYKSAYNALQDLNKEGIVDLIRIGNSINCKFKLMFNKSVFLAEYERRENLLKNKNFKLIYQDLSKLPFSFIAMLFGSYVKEKQTKHSDIDILVIGGDEKNVHDTLSLYPFKIHLVWFSHKDFISMAKSREFTVVSEALKKNVILIGIEDYYRLIQYAR